MSQLKRKFQPPPGTLAAGVDALGRTITIDEASMRHIRDEHRELAGMHLAVKGAIETTIARRRGNRPGHEIYFADGLGPSRYLAVVVRFREDSGRVVTAYGCQAIKGKPIP